MTPGTGQVARRRTREWELGDQVSDGSAVAGQVASDLRRAATFARLGQRPPRPHPNRHTASASRYAMMPEEVARGQALGALLARVRAGDRGAARELYAQHGAWIVGREAGS